jgi:hypothetical protein
MEIEASFVCSYCLQFNTVTVDPTGGTHQEYVEDCQICCRPNTLHITVSLELDTADINAVAA